MVGNILVVEDDEKVARSWDRLLTLDGWSVDHAESLSHAADALGSEIAYHTVILDLRLPDGRGDSLIPRLRRRRPRPQTLVVSGEISGAVAVALKGQVDWVLPKPVGGELLCKVVAKPKRDAFEEQLESFTHHFGLNEGEARIVELAGENLDNRVIADELGYTVPTVQTMWKRIFVKICRHGEPCHRQRDVFVLLCKHGQTVG